MKPFPFSPDWSSLVIERLEWLTDVLTSSDGHEQRVRLRTGARRSIEYSTLLGTDLERALAENLLHASQAASIDLPMWLDTAWLTAPVSVAGTSIAVDATADHGFEVGGAVALVSGARSEAAEVASVASNSVGLAAGVDAAWPAGAKLVPVVSARLQPTVSLSYLSDAVGRATLQFALADEWTVEPAAETADYLGYPVLTPQTNWTENPVAEYSRRVDEFDSVVGLRAFEDLSGVTSAQRAHRWLIEGRSAIASFRAWLSARAGRLVPFWIPSNQADLRVVSNVSSGATTLVVENRGYAQLFDSPGDLATIGRRDIMVLSTTGTRYYRRITAAVELGADTEQITINSALGVALTTAQISIVSFMHLVRFASDAVELAHHTDALVEATIPLASVRDDV